MPVIFIVIALFGLYTAIDLPKYGWGRDIFKAGLTVFIVCSILCVLSIAGNWNF